MIKDSEIIHQRWPTAEAFYAERDHRTQLVVENLHSYVNTPIEIHVSPHLAGDVTVQRIALLAANLTARWARNVRIFSPSVSLAEPLNRHGDKSLSHRIMREMHEADPFANFATEEYNDSYADTGTLRLFVGPPACSHQLTENDYVIDAHEWFAIGYRATEKVQPNLRLEAPAPTAALAASIGAGDLFKRAIHHPPTQWLQSVNWCTWHHRLSNHAGCCEWHPAITDKLDIGNLLVAGVGAVGSAFLYILSLTPCVGRVTVLDRDAVETSNLNRSPLFTALHAAKHMNKTEVAKNFLTSLGIESNAIKGIWREDGPALSQQAFDVWISLTNEDGAWAEVPFQLPPIVLHGTTTSGWGIAFGRHVPRKEDCTACRLPRPHLEFRGPCSEGELTPTNNVDPLRASLPFLSTASAALVAVELTKLNFPGVISLPNSVSADFRSGLQALIAVSFPQTKNCGGCRMAWLPLWKDRGGRGRYSRLSFSRGDECERVA